MSRARFLNHQSPKDSELNKNINQFSRKVTRKYLEMNMSDAEGTASLKANQRIKEKFL